MYQDTKEEFVSKYKKFFLKCQNNRIQIRSEESHELRLYGTIEGLAPNEWLNNIIGQ